ncbi:hypothetical protein E2C01_023374 [Portunus trituberculatus]|uniref:Uncharacterized protein n=1 Tax=Portunus trituberculatus TaxID=210409 RepID=A0A5B7E9V1_PORTR|nr:hypothetical protein [Portunus trituberculatus]
MKIQGHVTQQERHQTTSETDTATPSPLASSSSSSSSSGSSSSTSSSSSSNITVIEVTSSQVPPISAVTQTRVQVFLAVASLCCITVRPAEHPPLATPTLAAAAAGSAEEEQEKIACFHAEEIRYQQWLSNADITALFKLVPPPVLLSLRKPSECEDTSVLRTHGAETPSELPEVCCVVMRWAEQCEVCWVVPTTSRAPPHRDLN